MPKVSVIIPVYNAQDYLRRCLDSVCNQTLKDIEIICVNDCSTDNSLSILQEYAAKYPNMKVIDCKVNGGESVARNIGLDNATGEYLGFVDNDDEIDLDFYEKLYTKAKENDADIAKADVRIYDYDGKVVPAGWGGINEKLQKTQDKFYFSLYWWTAIYKRDMLKNNQIVLPENLILGGDIVFLNEAVACANSVAVVDDAFYHWYRRENSGDSLELNAQKIDSVLVAYEKVLSSMNQIYDTLKNRDSYLYVYNMFMMGIFGSIYRNKTEKCKENCINILFKMFNECRLKNDFYDMFLNEYPVIKGFIRKNQPSKMLACVSKYNTLTKLYITTIRNKFERDSEA